LPRTCNFYERTSGFKAGDLIYSIFWRTRVVYKNQFLFVFWESWLTTILIIVRAQLVSTYCYWHIIKEPPVPVLWIRELLVPGLSINNSESESQWFLFFEKN
jgi:hypothetical protein